MVQCPSKPSTSGKVLGWSAALALAATGTADAKRPVDRAPRPSAVYFVQGAESRGGEVRFFLESIALFRRNRVKVVLKDECASSCTLYTSLLQDGLICTRPGTKLVFHEFVHTADMVVEGGVLRSFKRTSPVAARSGTGFGAPIRRWCGASSPTGFPAAACRPTDEK